MSAVMSKKRPLTQQQKDASKRLKKAFKDTKIYHGHTYGSAALELGWTEGAVSHYMNGYNALNMPALIKMCALIRVNPEEIYPELFEGMDITVKQDPNDLLDKFNQLDPDMQNAVMTMIEVYRDTQVKNQQ